MRKQFSKKMLSLLLASSMVVGSTSMLTGCGSSKNEVITLDVYSQLANFSGEQTGWSADILLDELNIKINIIPDGDSVYETRMEAGNLGDIVIWSNDSDRYPNAVKAGMLYDWNTDDLLDEYGSYIKENMTDALAKNQELTKTITDGESDALYGFGHNVATSSEDHESFFYTWDIRWDLYKELGYPEVKDLDDYKKLLKDMQKANPTDDSGNKVYAVSLWGDWDDAMVMYVKASATAYYGYDELGIGLYDSENGEYYDALQKNGPYLTMLKFFNDLYQDGLVDPDSMTQTYDEMIAKVRRGGTLCSIFNYSGQLAYNTDEHVAEGKMMNCLKPEEATPIVYGMNTQGGDRVWSIGAKTEYPEECMELINYLCTPEGRMVMEHGPEGVCWNYNDDKSISFTDLGSKCHNDKNTKMGDPYEGSFQDGALQINNTTWSLDATNPDSNGETYNSDNWASNNSEAESDIEQDWRDVTGATSINDYMGNYEYKLAVGTSYSKGTKSDELKATWSQVTNCIKTGSWNAIYAKTDAEYNKIVNQMIKDANNYGYDACLDWSLNEASIRKGLEDAVKSGK